MIRRLLLVLLLLLPAPAAAQPTLASAFLEGSWALRLDGSIIMRFDLERQGEGWGGVWVKPTSFRSNGERFGNIVMPAVERTADRGRAIGEWAEITFDDPRPGEEPDQFRIRLIGPDKAEMIYVGTGVPPFTLERVAAEALLGPFVEGRVYGGPLPAARPALSPPALGPPALGATPAVAPPAARPVPAPAAPVRSQPAPQPEEPPVQGPPAMIGR